MPRTEALIRRIGPHLAVHGFRNLGTAASLGAVEVLSAPAFSRLVGKVAQSRNIPRPVLLRAIRWFIARYGIDTSEMEHPAEHYESFDAFFTRRLKPGTHQIDPDLETLVSPVDAKVASFGRIAGGRIEQVKGRDYALSELLDSDGHARRFEEGHYVTLYLSPKDYHRIHCPADGEVTGFRYIPGRLYPVNELGTQHIDKVFAVNERLVTFVESDLGELAIVKVGATNVGMITASYHDVCTNLGQKTAYDADLPRRRPIARGGELGMFHLGSTVVLVGSRPDVVPIGLEMGQRVRVGQRLFTRRG